MHQISSDAGRPCHFIEDYALFLKLINVCDGRRFLDIRVCHHSLVQPGERRSLEAQRGHGRYGDVDLIRSFLEGRLHPGLIHIVYWHTVHHRQDVARVEVFVSRQHLCVGHLDKQKQCDT